MLAKTYKFKGQWKGKSAGGCQNHPTWRYNPQLFLTVPEEKVVKVTLTQDARPEGEGLYHIGFYVAKSDSPERRQLIIARFCLFVVLLCCCCDFVFVYFYLFLLIFFIFKGRIWYVKQNLKAKRRLVLKWPYLLASHMLLCHVPSTQGVRVGLQSASQAKATWTSQSSHPTKSGNILVAMVHGMRAVQVAVAITHHSIATPNSSYVYAALVTSQSSSPNPKRSSMPLVSM